MKPSNSLRVLITAVGGDLGQALVKALRLSELPIEIHGCDMNELGIGSAFVDYYHVVPPAKDMTNYIRALDSLCKSLRIQVVVPGSEPEIDVLSKLGSPPTLPCGTVIVCHESQWIATYGDKLRCREALKGKVDLAPYADGTDRKAVEQLVAEVGFPVVVKSRRSSGSRSLRVANNYDQLQTYLSEIPLSLVEKYIDASGGEFSAGAFACDQFDMVIVFKRELGPGGCSWYAETSDDKEVVQYVKSIARPIHLRGSINIQVRKSREGVRLLEINPRFSSLVAARAICGFKDLEWAIRLVLGMEIGKPKENYRRIRFRRFLHELIDFGQGWQAIYEWSPKIGGKS